jgi:DHA1 family multidrug resistance protein-like MFS transporter
MNISRKQLVSLFLCSLVPWVAGYGLLPLLPVYARQLGASSAVSGYYLAFAYLAITLGALSAGWVSDRLNHRKLPLIITGVINIPLVWSMAKISSIWQLIAATSLLWFFGGLDLAFISILAGLSVGEQERGKIFGILAMTMGLGGLIGALGIGWLVDRWGYPTMFSILALFMALLPLISIFLKEKHVVTPRVELTEDQKLPGLGKGFYLLFMATILSSITGFYAMLIRSLVMSDLSFSPLEISSTGAVGGLFGMPFPLLMGWLSDRFGRKIMLGAGFLIAFASMVLLAFSRALWNFWMVFVGMAIASGCTGIGNAFVTDLVPHQSLGKGLAVYGSATWIGGIIGFTLAGYMLQYLGLVPAFVIGSILPLIAVGLLIPIRARSVLVKPQPII